MKKIAVVLLAAASLALGACGDDDDNDAVSPPPAATASAGASQGTSAVPAALNFTGTTVDGKQFNAATLAGKPAVLWFWASWCPDCRADAPKIHDLQQQYAGKVSFVGIGGLGSGDAAMTKFVTDYKLTAFPQLADDAGTVWKKFSIPSQRTFAVIDSSGEIVHCGPLTPEQLAQKLAGLN